MEAVQLPEYMKDEVAPLMAMMEPLNSQIGVLDAQLQRVAETDEQVALLCTAPQIGPVTASAFASAVDKPERFANGHQVSAYFGLVPSELSSGEKQRKGRITKAGNTRVRWLLVQAAISIMRVKAKETLPSVSGRRALLRGAERKRRSSPWPENLPESFSQCFGTGRRTRRLVHTKALSSPRRRHMPHEALVKPIN